MKRELMKKAQELCNELEDTEAILKDLNNTIDIINKTLGVAIYITLDLKPPRTFRAYQDNIITLIESEKEVVEFRIKKVTEMLEEL